MRVGFTGTQHGMTIEQGREVLDLLKRIPATELHHGCCVGADAQAHKIAKALKLPVTVWPPTNHSKLDYGAYADKEVKFQPADEYLLRNRKIVFFTEVLIACPKSREEELRSGTWSTVRYAKKLKRPMFVILPNGTVLEEDYAEEAKP